VDQKHGCFASAPSPAAAQMPSRTQPPRPSNGSYDYGLCTGADLATPALGATVSVTGPYVLDADHGWMEIHPVWSITVLAPAASSAPAASPHSGRQLACLAGTKDGLVTAIAAPERRLQRRLRRAHHLGRARPGSDRLRHGRYLREHTDGSGDATIRLWHTSPGETITVTVDQTGPLLNTGWGRPQHRPGTHQA